MKWRFFFFFYCFQLLNWKCFQLLNMSFVIDLHTQKMASWCFGNGCCIFNWLVLKICAFWLYTKMLKNCGRYPPQKGHSDTTLIQGANWIKVITLTFYKCYKLTSTLIGKPISKYSKSFKVLLPPFFLLNGNLLQLLDDFDYWSCKFCSGVLLDVAGAVRRGRWGNCVIPVISGF